MLARLRGDTLTTPRPEGPDKVLGPPDKEAEVKYKMMTDVMQGGGLSGLIANLGLSFVKNNPRLRATMLLGIVGTDPAAGEKQMAKQLGGESGKRIARLIVEERNQEAISGLRRYIGQGKTGETIALFYGAAHLDGIEDALIRRFGYVPENTEWLVAIHVDGEEAGLTRETLQEKLPAGAARNAWSTTWTIRPARRPWVTYITGSGSCCGAARRPSRACASSSRDLETRCTARTFAGWSLLDADG